MQISCTIQISLCKSSARSTDHCAYLLHNTNLIVHNLCRIQITVCTSPAKYKSYLKGLHSELKLLHITFNFACNALVQPQSQAPHERCPSILFPCSVRTHRWKHVSRARCEQPMRTLIITSNDLRIPRNLRQTADSRSAYMWTSCCCNWPMNFSMGGDGHFRPQTS